MTTVSVQKGSGKDILMILAFMAGLVIIFYMLAKREIGSFGESIAGAIPKLPEINLPFSAPQYETDKQTLNRLTTELDSLAYYELEPEVRGTIQEALGTTQAYYEEFGTQMSWEAFQHGIDANVGSYGEGFDGTTTISRSLIPVGYTGAYYAGKRVVNP